MKQVKRKSRQLNTPQKSWPALLLAFLIPFIGMCAVMVAFKVEPFGDNRAFLYCDEYHQYYPFFVSYRKALLSGESLLWNWDVGAGGEYLGLIAYYLGSPLNLLSVFVPEKYTLELFAILMPVRLGLAGLFFAIFLKKIFNKNDISIALFGAFYGLCAWALSYQWNVMWLDTFALLPLVILGTVSLLRDRKFVLYTFTLFLSVAINYYIGLFTCIFVLLVFICYEICRYRGLGRLAADLGWIALFSIVAIGMTAFISLPTFLALQKTSSGVNSFPEGFKLNLVNLSTDFPYTKEAWDAFNAAKESGAGFLTLAKDWIVAAACSVPPLLQGMYLVAGGMTGGMAHNFKATEGLPNIYCGIFAIVMAFLCLTSNKIRLRDRICSVALLVFLMLSFLSRQLDYMWHGFHFTNMIPYRFSFLFSFVLLYMAYQAWVIRDSFKVWQLVVAGLFSLAVVLCCSKITEPVTIAYNAVFLLLSIGLFVFILLERKLSAPEEAEADAQGLMKIAKRRNVLATLVLTVVLGLEIILNLANFGFRFSYTSITNYPRGTGNAVSTIGYMKYRERNNLFYRAEATHTQTLNDGALNGYHGITTFSSAVNSNATRFMMALGLGAGVTANRYAYEDTSPVTNLFLNLKYMIDREGNVPENSYFEEIHSFGDVTLLENQAYLPLGFLANSEIQDWDMEASGNSFDHQTDLFNLATGLNARLFQRIPAGCISITSEDVELFNTNEAGGYTAYFKDNEGTITYAMTMITDGLLCLDADVFDSNDIEIYKDGTTKVLSENIGMPQNLAVCEVKAGDIIEIDVKCKRSDRNSSVDIDAAILKKDVFMKGYEILKASTLELTEFSTTKVAGHIDCNRKGLVYTSIPSDGYWEATVDGEKAETVLVGNCMLAVPVTEGEHEIVLRYRNQPFYIGLTVSIVSGLIFLGLIALSVIYPPNPGKYVKPPRPRRVRKTPPLPEAPAAEVTVSPEAPLSPEVSEDTE